MHEKYNPYEDVMLERRSEFLKDLDDLSAMLMMLSVRLDSIDKSLSDLTYKMKEKNKCQNQV